MPATTGNFCAAIAPTSGSTTCPPCVWPDRTSGTSERGGFGQPARIVREQDRHRRRVRASAPRCRSWRLVQKRMPTRSIVSFLIVSRVRASFSICTPFLPSAAGMS